MERDKKKVRVNAHKKVVSRIISKKYLGGLRENGY